MADWDLTSLGSRWARGLIHLAIAAPALPLLLLAAALARIDTTRRRRKGRRPRLVWGPVPIINIKYWSESLRARGYQTQTCVAEHYAMNSRTDFDRYFADFMPPSIAFDPLRAYAVFLWSLRTADLYCCFFDGGFLQATPLRGLELPLLRLAGKRTIVSPYGSDIAVRGHLGVIEARIFDDYPGLAQRAGEIQARIMQFARWAHCLIRNYQLGFMPRWDVTWPTQLAIDVDLWHPTKAASQADGRDEEVVIIHAPNHRRLKGTDLLIDAVEKLSEEGLRVRLQLLERRPNLEIREAMADADIVADQFIAGYALFAIEGMASGKPVLSSLSGMPGDVRASLELRGLPILDTHAENLIENLRCLVLDPERRQRLGQEGRRFVLQHHSYDAVGSTWEEIIQRVWSDLPLPDVLPLESPRSTPPLDG